MDRQVARMLRRPVLLMASVLATSLAVKGEEQGAGDETKSGRGCRFGWP
jgi:hypothetical protein